MCLTIFKRCLIVMRSGSPASVFPQMPPLNPYGGMHPAFRPPVSAAMQKVASMPILGHPVSFPGILQCRVWYQVEPDSQGMGLSSTLTCGTGKRAGAVRCWAAGGASGAQANGQPLPLGTRSFRPLEPEHLRSSPPATQ